VRSKALLVLSLIFAAVSCSFANAAAPVDCAHLLGWLAGDASTYSLTKAVERRGSIVSLTVEAEAELLAAGATPELLTVLHRSQPKVSAHDVCPATLAEAAADSRHKQFDAAESLIAGLLEGDPHNSALHFALGYFSQQRGHWDDAFDEYSASKESDPDFAAVHNRLALVFYEDNDGDDAVGEARTALSMDFDDAEAYRMLALGQYSNEQYAAAMNAFKQALSRDPANADVYYEMGLVARDQNSQDEAVRLFRKSLQLNPDRWQAHSSLGSLLGKEKQFGEGITELNKAKALNPKEPSIRENLASIYFAKGEYDTAIAEYHELYRANPAWKHGHRGTEAGRRAEPEQRARPSRARSVAVSRRSSGRGHPRASCLSRTGSRFRSIPLFPGHRIT
jgi:tetratricopeptide (TPR) repeat protein